jgi:predicted DCC family thiol-disulfide oxidoreductase YuxK
MAATVSTPHADAAASLRALPERIVFFDGVCGFCDGTMKWLLEKDAEERLHFAPLQGSTADAVRNVFPEFPTDVDTFVYLEPSNDAIGRRISLRSAALFALAADMENELRWVRRFAWLPRWLADLLYRAFASNRYRMFGKLEACDIPTPSERARLLP